MKGIVAIKRYFESEPYGRKVEMSEMQSLSKDEKAELGQLACDELGQPYEPPQEG